ncbi:MAG: DUF4304 domain-containing protein [Thermonemataceae bacterium]
MKSADFKKIVTKEIAPFLREQGWKGTGFNYTKHIGNIIRALTIQPSSAGGKFCVEIGIHFDFIPLKGGKEFTKMKTWDMEIRTRLTPHGESDFWWDFPTNENDRAQLFDALRELITTRGEAYFKPFDQWKEIITKFSIDDIENGNTKSLFKIPPLSTALLLARINDEIGNREKAIAFSKYGLSKIQGKKGAGLIPDFKSIIEKADKPSYSA